MRNLALMPIRKIPAIIAATLILFFISRPLPGGQIDEKQNELKKIEEKLELERKSLGKFKARERFILKEMDKIEKRYQMTEQEIVRLDGLEKSLKNQIEELTVEIARVELEISQKLYIYSIQGLGFLQQPFLGNKLCLFFFLCLHNYLS